MYFCIMKQAIIDKRTLEKILSDQRNEIEIQTRRTTYRPEQPSSSSCNRHAQMWQAYLMF